MAARLQRSGEYDIFLKMSPSALDQLWTLRTQVMSSCRLNVRIPLTHRTWRTGHQPGFSQSQGQIQELRVLMWLQMPHGKTHCLSMQPPALPCAKHNHLAPHSFTRYQPLISGCRVWKTLLSYSHDTSPPTAACCV